MLLASSAHNSANNVAKQAKRWRAESRLNWPTCAWHARVFGVAVEQVERADGAYLPDGRRVAFDSSGVDQVEFMISANPGEPLKPMAKVASGGETARLMLGAEKCA